MNTKRKKGVVLTLIYLLSLCLVGCGKQPTEEQVEMPEIVFTRMYVYGDYSGIFWCIDKDGNIMKGKNEELALSSFDISMEIYKKHLDQYEKIGSIEIEELQEKYQTLYEIVNGDDNVEIREDLFIEMELDEEIWNGYCYDKDNVLSYVLLYKAGNPILTNQDPRAEELAAWLDKVLGEDLEDVTRGEKIPFR